MEAALLALTAQLSPAIAGFHVVDMSSVDAPWAGTFEQLSKSLPHRMRIVGRRGLGELLETIDRELERRLNNTPAAESIFLVLVGLHRMRDLREDDGYSQPEQDGLFDVRRAFAKILREGPEVGIHCLIWGDSQSAVSRVLDRRMLGDCGRRIVGPMSEQDSMVLIDEPTAGRLDKPHRLIRFDEDRPGDLEIFRPYGVPTAGWVATEARKLHDRAQ
jgi:S-DNA-T family DNA segregation ATPase FtsK/SpoIIIE